MTLLAGKQSEYAFRRASLCILKRRHICSCDVYWSVASINFHDVMH